MKRLCLLLLVGGLGAQHIRVAPDSNLCVAMVLAAFLALAVGRWRAPACLALGAALFWLAGQGLIEGRLDPRFEGDSLLTRVRVADFPVRDENGVTFVVVPVGDGRLPARARVSWFEPRVVPMLGEVWELELRLKRPRGASNPGGFDRETWLFRERVLATGYVVDGPRNRLIQGTELSLRERIRRHYVDLAAAAADSDRAAAVLAAVGAGARHRLSRQQWDDFARTGTTHLMAISGLHVGLAASLSAGLGLLLAGPLRGRGSPIVVASAAGVLGAFLYAWISGFAVPARRATLMLALAACALVLRRRVDSRHALLVAAAVIFVLDPVASLAPGFALSFGAVAILIWLTPLWRPARPGSRRARLAARAAALAVLQGHLFVGLAPLTIVLFRRIAALSIPVNLLAVPWFSVVTVPLALAGLLLGGVAEGTAAKVLGLAASSIDALDGLLQFVSALPLAAPTLAAIAGPALGLALLPLLWVLLPRGWPGREVALVGLCALVLWRPQPPPAGCFDAWTLDVGQGLATVVRTARHALLFDTGMAWRNGGSAAESTVLPFLSALAIPRLDWLVVSHADLDHAGGVDALLAQSVVRRMLVGEADTLPQGRQAALCAAGQHWRSDGIDIRMLYPGEPGRYEGNDASCVLRVSTGSYGLLLTGDIEAEAERRLLASARGIDADVVVVPHHGSRTSSSPAFVDALRPEVAIVSAGHANRWGFPKPEVVARWNSAGATVLETASAGAIGIRICARTGIERIVRHRDARRRFWHAR